MSRDRSKYDASHKAIRNALLPNAYGKPCHFCGLPMLPGQSLDLDHTEDGRAYRGLTHATCNRRDGAQRGNKMRNPKSTTIGPPVAFAAEIHHDRSMTAVAMAGRLPDGRVGVRLVAHLPATEHAATIAALVDQFDAAEIVAVVVDPRSPSVTLVAALAALGVAVTEPGPRDLALAHGQFLDDLRAGRLGIESHPALDAAAQFATSRVLAGSEAIERRRGEADPAPLVAAELAVWALSNVTPEPAFAGGFTDLDSFFDDDDTDY